MVTKRTPLHRPTRARVTPEALAAFEAADWLALHRALALKPWHVSPLDADDGPAPDWVGAADWAQAQRLRAELQAAVAAEVP